MEKFAESETRNPFLQNVWDYMNIMTIAKEPKVVSFLLGEMCGYLHRNKKYIVAGPLRKQLKKEFKKLIYNGYDLKDEYLNIFEEKWSDNDTVKFVKSQQIIEHEIELYETISQTDCDVMMVIQLSPFSGDHSRWLKLFNNIHYRPEDTRVTCEYEGKTILFVFQTDTEKSHNAVLVWNGDRQFLPDEKETPIIDIDTKCQLITVETNTQVYDQNGIEQLASMLAFMWEDEESEDDEEEKIDIKTLKIVVLDSDLTDTIMIEENDMSIQLIPIKESEISNHEFDYAIVELKVSEAQNFAKYTYLVNLLGRERTYGFMKSSQMQSFADIISRKIFSDIHISLTAESYIERYEKVVDAIYNK